MQNIRAYEEKSERYGLTFPFRVARLAFPENAGILFYPHWHREFELFFVTAGTLIFTLEDTEYFLQKGQGVFVPSERLHTARSADGMPCDFVAVVFYGSALCGGEDSVAYAKYIMPVVGGSVVFRNFFKPSDTCEAAVINLLWDIANISSAELSRNELYVKGKLCEIWSLCFLNPSEVRADYGKDTDRIRPIYEFILHHYAEDISIIQLASFANLSMGHFCRVFKAKTGMTPVLYIQRHRILQSCRLLRETKHSVTDIANRTGFNNISYYNKVFRRIIGCTPSVYRKDRI